MAPAPTAQSCPSASHPAAPLQSQRDRTTNAAAAAAAGRHHAGALAQQCFNKGRLLTGAAKLSQKCIEDM